MKVNIYDYSDKSTEIEIPEISDIKSISVEVISGDEVVTVTDKSGKEILFDSSDCRACNFYDSQYRLTTPERILEWINYPSSHEMWETVSYERAEAFEFAED